MNWRKFLIFFVLFFAMSSIIQIWIFESDQPIKAVLVKTAISGLVASAFFTLITKKWS